MHARMCIDMHTRIISVTCMVVRANVFTIFTNMYVKTKYVYENTHTSEYLRMRFVIVYS